jgi:phosphoribosylamine--glycine ligase
VKVLVVGSGGREAALVWWLSRSARVNEVLCAPGNAGLPGARPVAADDLEGVAALATTEAVDLVVVGPEVPLAAGLVDRLQAAGVPTFGPSAAAARLEGSKVWAKGFMNRWGIPTPPSRTFADADAALAHLDTLGQLPVVKASGLAAGKGVLLPTSHGDAAAAIRAMLVEGRFGAAGAEILLEERLDGREVSIQAVCAGTETRRQIPAQDHKRLADGDRGPNTGGMGAFAPSGLPDGLLARVEEEVIAPTLAGLAAEGAPYLGVLYAGVMLTESGPQVLEFNCRFGDPETQVILPLCASDPVDVFEAALAGKVPEIDWHDGAALTVVMAAPGYPDDATRGLPILGIEDAEDAGCLVFTAGVARGAGGGLVTAGGRVLNVTATGPTLADAAATAYDGVGRISFEGAQWRTDIGRAAAA